MDLSSPSHPVLSCLLRKRQEIEDEIKGHETALHGLVTAVDALDATIRLFAPSWTSRPCACVRHHGEVVPSRATTRR